MMSQSGRSKLVAEGRVRCTLRNLQVKRQYLNELMAKSE
jgi:hypothetical protein